jgi:hypothetical protein
MIRDVYGDSGIRTMHGIDLAIQHRDGSCETQSCRGPLALKSARHSMAEAR